MNRSRRTFVKNAAALSAGTLLWPGSDILSPVKPAIISLQLYSVRDDMKADPGGTLRQVAAMGYANVEHANYNNRKFYGYTASDFRQLLDGLGLKMPSGHVSFQASDWDASKNDFSDRWKYTLEDAVTAGQQYVISPSMDEEVRNSYDALMQTLDIFNRCGEFCRKYGLQFGYHNHEFEFKYSFNGKKIYDLILSHTDPSLVCQQIDIGNMYIEGGMALDIIRRYPGRFVSMHVKDEIKSGKQEIDNGLDSTVLGSGILDVKGIVNRGRTQGGTSLFVVEQESYQGRAPLDCVKADLQFMKKIIR